MEPSKRYDVLLDLLVSLMKDAIILNTDDVIRTIEAFSVSPDDDSLEFVVLVCAMYLLHVHGVPLKSNVPFIHHNFKEIIEVMESIDTLKQHLSNYTNQMTDLRMDSVTAEA